MAMATKFIYFNVTSGQSSILSDTAEPRTILLRPQSQRRFQQWQSQPQRTPKSAPLQQETRNTSRLHLAGRATLSVSKSLDFGHIEPTNHVHLSTNTQFSGRLQLRSK